ncbi:MAG: sulfotransferase [Thalassotalea sp.]|nr:sulfotransferase [Thalassotalea sp.]
MFILGVGRSGTTLIQRILNSYDEVIIWGEHDGFLKSLAKSWQQLKTSTSMDEYCYSKQPSGELNEILKYSKDPKTWQAWTNWFKANDTDDLYRDFVGNTFNPNNLDNIKVWGFKEIRYGNESEVIHFLKTLYPDAIFLCVVRDALNVIESQLKTFYLGTSKYPKIKRLMQLSKVIKIANDWKRSNLHYLKLSQTNENFHFIKYEEFLNDRTVINPILEKLDLKFSATQENIINLKDGTGSSYVDKKNVNERWQLMGSIPIFIAETIIGQASIDLGYKRPEKFRKATKLSSLFNTRINN